MAALLEVVHLRRLAQPEIPVEPGGHRHWRERSLAQAARDEHGHLRQLADAAVPRQLARQPKELVAALLRAGLEHDAVLAHGLDHALALVDRQGQRLLGVDVLLGRRRGDVDDRVPMVRRRLDDDVDVLALEHATEVRELGRDFLVLRELLCRPRRVDLVDVAHGDDVAEPAGALGVAAAHATAPDERHPGAIDGRGDRGHLLGRLELPLHEPQRQSGGGGDGGAIANKGPARDVDGLGHSNIERQTPLPAQARMGSAAPGSRITRMRGSGRRDEDNGSGHGTRIADLFSRDADHADLADRGITGRGSRGSYRSGYYGTRITRISRVGVYGTRADHADHSQRLDTRARHGWSMEHRIDPRSAS